MKKDSVYNLIIRKVTKKNNNSKYCKCSNTYISVADSNNPYIPIHYSRDIYYCPWCGKKLRESEK